MVLYAIVGLSVLNALVSPFLDRGDALRDAPSTADGVEVSLGVGLALLVVFVLLGLGFLLLYVLCARKMLEGRNWARLTATVLVGLGVLFASINIVASSYTTIRLVTLVIGVVLGVAFLFLAWQRPSNEFFATAGRLR